MSGDDRENGYSNDDYYIRIRAREVREDLPRDRI
jgi:hypothetical protein